MKNIVILISVIWMVASCSMFKSKQELISEVVSARNSLDDKKARARRQSSLVKDLEKRFSETPNNQSGDCWPCQALRNNSDMDLIAINDESYRPSQAELEEERRKLKRLKESIRFLQEQYNRKLKKCLDRFDDPEEGKKNCVS